MINELLFLAHVAIISTSLLTALRFGQQALISLICLLVVIANIFLLKQISLFGFIATATDAYTVGSVLGLNLLQEYYGRSVTRNAIWISFFILIFYAIISQIHLIYVPAHCDFMQTHYQPLLQCMPRIITASFFTYFVVAQLDVYLFAYLQRLFSGNYLTLRTFISILICQLLDTVLFSFLGLYGIINNIWQVITISYCIKVITILAASPFIGLSKRVFKPSDDKF